MLLKRPKRSWSLRPTVSDGGCPVQVSASSVRPLTMLPALPRPPCPQATSLTSCRARTWPPRRASCSKPTRSVGHVAMPTHGEARASRVPVRGDLHLRAPMPFVHAVRPPSPLFFFSTRPCARTSMKSLESSRRRARRRQSRCGRPKTKRKSWKPVRPAAGFDTGGSHGRAET